MSLFVNAAPFEENNNIVENKKTFLYLKTLEVADIETKKKLKYYYRKKLKENTIKITDVTRIYQINDIPFLMVNKTSEAIEHAKKNGFI